MNYVDHLMEQSNLTTTFNGAVAYKSTGNECLNLFAVAGGMRYRKPKEQIRLFDRAYTDDPELAMKLLFHIRDIRGGMGERRLFRTLLRHVATTWPESAVKNVRYIAEYGRWDDLLCLLDTPAEHEVVRVIREQLDRDLDALQRRNNGEADAPISLLAKWMPSNNTSSHATRELAQKLSELLELSPKDYRRTLIRLRAAISLTERHLSRKQPERINYPAVPSGAMLKYRRAFVRNDAQRFSAYISDALAGRQKMHADTLFPYEVLRPVFSEIAYSSDFSKKLTPEEKLGLRTIDALWKNMNSPIGNQNALSIVDTSGSMYCAVPGAPVPALISQAMGLYCAEHCSGPFHNMFITFSAEPELVKIKGTSLSSKLRSIQGADWGMNTNLEAVFELILNAAISAKATQEEMPGVLYIFSDMEFDCAVHNPDMTVFESARLRFEAAGYQLPAVVFHNVNSWRLQTPVSAHTKGAALTSGASTSALSEHFDGNVTPMSNMLRVLNGKRYEVIHA